MLMGISLDYVAEEEKKTQASAIGDCCVVCRDYVYSLATMYVDVRAETGMKLSCYR